MAKKEIKISEEERKCLEYLAEIYPNDEANVSYFRGIASHTGYDEKAVRRYVRSLARKGLAQYVNGLFDEDGMTAGSGYCATHEGASLIDPCDKCGELTSYGWWEDENGKHVIESFGVKEVKLCSRCYDKQKTK